MKHLRLDNDSLVMEPQRSHQEYIDLLMGHDNSG
jgi:hypothetical protein